MPKKKGPIVNIEVISSENIKYVVGQSEIELETSDQSKKLDQVKNSWKIERQVQGPRRV